MVQSLLLFFLTRGCALAFCDVSPIVLPLLWSTPPFDGLPCGGFGTMSRSRRRRLLRHQPSVVNSLAQLSARGSARTRRGESSSVSLHTPRFPGGGFLAEPSLVPAVLLRNSVLRSCLKQYLLEPRNSSHYALDMSATSPDFASHANSGVSLTAESARIRSPRCRSQPILSGCQVVSSLISLQPDPIFASHATDYRKDHWLSSLRLFTLRPAGATNSS